MSAPDTNLNRQVKWHKPVLIGFIAIAIGVTVALLWFGSESDQNDAAPNIGIEPGS